MQASKYPTRFAEQLDSRFTASAAIDVVLWPLKKSKSRGQQQTHSLENQSKKEYSLLSCLIFFCKTKKEMNLNLHVKPLLFNVI